jgi:hypothetical protein
LSVTGRRSWESVGVFELHDLARGPDALISVALALLGDAHGPTREVNAGAVKLVLEGLDLGIAQQPADLGRHARIVQHVLRGLAREGGDLAELLHDVPAGFFDEFNEGVHAGVPVVARSGRRAAGLGGARDADPAAASANGGLGYCARRASSNGEAVFIGGFDQIDVGLSSTALDDDVAPQPAQDLVAAPEHLAGLAKRVEAIPGAALLLQDGALALVIVEEERREGVPGARVDDDAAVPPPNARRADQQGVDGGHGDGKGIVANSGAGMGGDGWHGRDKIGLARRRIGVDHVDLDVDRGGVAKLGLGDPGEQ